MPIALLPFPGDSFLQIIVSINATLRGKTNGPRFSRRSKASLQNLVYIYIYPSASQFPPPCLSMMVGIIYQNGVERGQRVEMMFQGVSETLQGLLEGPDGTKSGPKRSSKRSSWLPKSIPEAFNEAKLKRSGF